MSDHYHYGYADERHDHCGQYAEDRHDHGLDYAEKYHRHYDDESTVQGLREDLSAAEGRIRELEDDLRDALNRIHALEDRLPGYAAQEEPEDDHWRDYSYTCSTCGAQIGIFIDHGDGWHHYRGEGTVASPVELYDAGHEATLAEGGQA